MDFIEASWLFWCCFHMEDVHTVYYWSWVPRAPESVGMLHIPPSKMHWDFVTPPISSNFNSSDPYSRLISLG